MPGSSPQILAPATAKIALAVMLADVARQSATAQGRAEWDKAIVAAEKKDRLRSTARPGLAIETQSARS